MKSTTLAVALLALVAFIAGCGSDSSDLGATATVKGRVTLEGNPARNVGILIGTVVGTTGPYGEFELHGVEVGSNQRIVVGGHEGSFPVTPPETRIEVEVAEEYRPYDRPPGFITGISGDPLLTPVWTVTVTVLP